MLTIQHYLASPGLTTDVLVLADTGQWDHYFDFFEIRKVRAPSVMVGGMPYAMFVRDFRAIPVDDWLHLMLERDLTGAPNPLPCDDVEPVALARDAFEIAVRDALRDLRRPDRLAANPLSRSRLVARDGKAEDLANVLRAAIEQLSEDPRSLKQARALETTYVRGAPTQEAAAELLDLPMTTYKPPPPRSGAGGRGAVGARAGRDLSALGACTGARRTWWTGSGLVGGPNCVAPFPHDNTRRLALRPPLRVSSRCRPRRGRPRP